jgi:hypothetical protein
MGYCLPQSDCQCRVSNVTKTLELLRIEVDKRNGQVRIGQYSISNEHLAVTLGPAL